MESEQGGNIELSILLAIGMTLFALLAGSVVLFFLVYQKRLLQQRLAFSQLEASHTEALLHSNIEQVEEERKRIAKDLHDEVGSIFSTLKLKFNQLAAQNQSTPLPLVIESLQVIDTGMASVRRISHGITPPGLEMFGLPDAIEALCDPVHSSTLDITFTCPPDFPRLPPRQELGLYRIVQELLNNAIKHADATKIAITLRVTGESVVLHYLDNGKGFDPAILHQRKGMGIKNVEARASQLMATTHWTTQPGQGVQTIITVPVCQD